MMNKPNKIFVTYEQDANGDITFKEIVKYSENGYEKEQFDESKHLALLGKFFGENGVKSIEEAEEKGIFARFNADEVNVETLDGFLGIETNNTPEEEEVVEPTVDSEAKEEPVVTKPVVEPEQTEEPEHYGLTEEELAEDDHKTLKRVGAGVLAGAAAIGMLAMLHSCSEQKIDNQKQENEEDLYKNMTEEQKAFFEPAFKAVEAFNARTTEDGTFKLDKDATTLHITADETVALSILMNDYTSEELYNIFGTLEFDTNNLMSLARSAYSKLSTYYMNAKEPSGLSQIIRDEDAREFFERHENAVIAFNNNPSTELSDKVIKGLYYDYVHQGSTGNYAKIENDGVAWFATSAGFGFELANRNMPEYLRVNSVSEEEIAQYGDAAIASGMKLSKITTSDLLKGINEEVDLDVMDEIDNKSLCASVTTQTRDRVDGLKLKQQIAVTIVRSDAKGRLVEGLQNIGANSLANKVMAADITLSEELLEEIRSHNASADNLVEQYGARISSITDKEALVVAVMDLAQQRYGLDSEIDIADLVNNRFRTKEKVKDQTSDKKGTTISKEEFDKLDKDEKDKYIKDNGTVIKTETTKTEVEVKEDELTEDEKKDVVDQKKVLKEIEDMQNALISQGSADAITYTEEKGAYNYNKKVVNPYNNETIETSKLSLFNIVAHVSAFGEGAENINSKDAQIQTRMNSDAKKVTSMIDSLSDEAKAYLKDQYGSDWKEDFIKETYISGYTTQIDGSLKVAREMGVELKKSAKDAYDKAQAALNTTPPTTDTTDKNPTKEPTDTKPETKPTDTKPTPGPTETKPTVDPNLGEQFEEDEKPYVPNSPVEFDTNSNIVEQVEWDRYFTDQPVEPERAPRIK